MIPKELLAGKYRLEQLVGTGGWGLVYRGENVTLGKPVAVKILHDHLVAQEEKVARFRRESRAAAALRHPGICSVYDVGTTEGGLPFYVMEYVSGKTLHTLIDSGGPMPADKAVDLCTKVCRAVATAHEAGIIHRDLTASNIMIKSDGEPILLDFGLAKITDGIEEQGSLTESGAILGSPAYMSPEQCLGQKLDARSDIYSLGCVLYEMLTGDPPFSGATIMATMHSHVTEPVPPLPKTISVQPQVAGTLMRALSKNPDQRPQSMLDFADQLTGSKKTRRLALWNAIATKNLVPLAGGAALLTAVAGGALWFFLQGKQPAHGPAVATSASTDTTKPIIPLEQQADTEFATMRALFEKHNYQQARISLDRLMALCANNQVSADKAARMLSLVGASYQALEMKEQAISAARLAITRLRQFCKPTSHRLIEQQLALVNMLLQQGSDIDKRNTDWAQPRPWFQADKILANLRETLAGEKSMDRERNLVLGQTLNLLLVEHRFKKCAELGESVLPNLANISEFDSETANVLQSVAQSWFFLGDRKRAMQLYDQALARTKFAGRPGVWGPAQIYGTLGTTYNVHGEYRTACDYFEKALAQYAHEPADSPFHHSVENLLAMASMRCGDSTAGYKIYKTSLRATLMRATPVLHEALSPYERPVSTAISPHTFSAPMTFNPKTIQSIPDLKNLEALGLAGVSVTDADIGRLGHLDKLKRLFLASTDVTDDLGQYLQQFPNLELLDMSVTPIGTRTARAVSKLHHLGRLDASVTQLKDGDMQYLAQCPSLKRLSLAQTAVSDRGLEGLSSSRSLMELDIGESYAVTDKGVASLQKMPALIGLELTRNCVVGQGLTGLKNLKYLFFVTPHSEADVSFIKNMHGLKRLWIVDTAATDDMLASLGELSEIQELNLACTDITDKTISLLPRLPHLKILNLNHTGLTDAGLAYIAQCHELEELHISQTAVHSLKPLAALKNLKLLAAGDDQIEDKDLTAIAALPQLQLLSLDYSTVEREAVKTLAGTSALRTLAIRGIPLTSQEIVSLSQAPGGKRRMLRYSAESILPAVPPADTGRGSSMR